MFRVADVLVGGVVWIAASLALPAPSDQTVPTNATATTKPAATLSMEGANVNPDLLEQGNSCHPLIN